MAKKTCFVFLLAALVSFVSISAGVPGTSASPLNEIENAAENLPAAKEFGLIASSLKMAAETYRSVKAQIEYTIGYSQKIIQSIKEPLKKIKRDGIKMKEYIENKINFLSKKYAIILCFA